ncbi:unnamed protein product [Peronospora farinosa]|uniref:Uncharacterized protein n=1 Tax=Peronospora farinosa TaxID=134698 RepID=A0AAV0TLI0_9STRA|nr:unnamed protein product [Peronospora farinosa]
MQDLKPDVVKVVLRLLESAGKTNGLGLQNDAVLLQEYLEGDEFVVDTVSRNGEHKVTAIWKYDKRRVNDAASVYFGLSLVPAEGVVNEVIDYQLQVLDGNGPAHGEVRFCCGSPVLIDIDTRYHGGILDGGAFAKLAERPRKLLAHGYVVMIVSYKNGVMKSIPCIAIIEKVSAYLEKAIYVAPGDNMRQTVDMFTTPGNIMLKHKEVTRSSKVLLVFANSRSRGFRDGI